MSTATSQTDQDKQAFWQQLQSFVGKEIGPPQPAPDEVNIPMIRHWCEAIGDNNPIYLDSATAAASIHQQIVAPPTMLQAWVMAGIKPRVVSGTNPYEEMNQLLFSHNFTSVVATNCEQTYDRYLHPGDKLSMTTTIDSISPEKTTALGTGHFITTRQDYFDQNNQRVGSMLFRIIRFRPAARKETASNAVRPRPATTHDNSWWFDGLQNAKLFIQRCTKCQALRFPPGPVCPTCVSMDWEPVEAVGTGTIHSFVITHYPQVPGLEYPLPVLLIDLDEGVRMVMNPIDTDIADLAIGKKVDIVLRATDDELTLPFAKVHK